MRGEIRKKHHSAVRSQIRPKLSFERKQQRPVLLQSQSKVTQAGMVVGTAAQGPSEFAIAFGYREIIDAGDPTAHQAVFVEFPILIAVSAKPIAAVVVILVGEANGDTIPAKGPSKTWQTAITKSSRSSRLIQA